MQTMSRDRWLGIALVLVPILDIAGFSVGADVGEYDPFAREDTRELLLAINGHQSLYVLSLGAFVILDAIWTPMAAGLLYLTFRDRMPAVALLGGLGLMLGAALILAHDSTAMSLGFLAQDFAEKGGAGDIAAGADATLATARLMGLLEGFLALCAQTAFGFGLIAFGALIAWAPRGERNPPVPLGILAAASGVAYICMWSFLLDHTVGGAITLIGELAVLVTFGWLGVWFLRQPRQAEVASPAAAPARP
jgi:hypothetical protein